MTFFRSWSVIDECNLRAVNVRGVVPLHVVAGAGPLVVLGYCGGCALGSWVLLTTVMSALFS